MENASLAELADMMATLARNNINILGVTYVGSVDGMEIGAVVFEYQWRVTPVATKWTRAVIPWYGKDLNTYGEYKENYARVLETVRKLRANLEG